MPPRPSLLAALAALHLATPALADTLTITDAYARASSPLAMSGAAFMLIENGAETDDRLLAARSGAAARAELHTHLEGADGVMRMVEVEDGLAVPAGGTLRLRRGGDHVMLMGLAEPFVHGRSIRLTLTFEHAGDVTIEVPIDLERRPGTPPGG